MSAPWSVGTAAAAPGEKVRGVQFVWLRSEHTGCWYPAVRSGERVSKGQVVGVIMDYWGDVLVEHRAPASGVTLFVVTSLAINPTDPLLGVGTA